MHVSNVLSPLKKLGVSTHVMRGALTAGICYVSNVAVDSSARRRGVARALMAAAEATAADWGFRCVALVS